MILPYLVLEKIIKFILLPFSLKNKLCFNKNNINGSLKPKS